MDIHELTHDVISELLSFKLKYYDVSVYLSDRASADWRGFEAEQHSEYPIQGCGLIANDKLLQNWTFKNESLLHPDEDLAPEETGSEIDSFPRDTVSIVYMFSLLEAYGNDICDEINPNYRNNRQAWHHGVYGNADLNDSEQKIKMQNNFCKPFNPQADSVPNAIVEALVILKRERNNIVHELTHSSAFEFHFRSIMAIICCLYFRATRNPRELKIYPWYDYDDKFKP